MPSANEPFRPDPSLRNAPPSLRLRPDDEWLLLRERHLNVVIEGEESRIEETIVTLTPHLRPNVKRWAPGHALDLVAHFDGTLIIEQVDALSAIDQSRLLQWLRADADRTIQVVSTTSLSLYRLVSQAMFNRELYYYLNTLRLDIA